jgi:hypothetical protein
MSWQRIKDNIYATERYQQAFDQLRCTEGLTDEENAAQCTPVSKRQRSRRLLEAGTT